VLLHLVKVLFSSSLGLSSFGVKVNTNLGQGFLRNPCLLLPHGKRLLSVCDPPPALGDTPIALQPPPLIMPPQQKEESEHWRSSPVINEASRKL
jgi:hypothetical protein